jgi:hypothetical protein
VVAGRASHSAACAWVGGELAELERHGGDGFAVWTLEWEP